MAYTLNTHGTFNVNLWKIVYFETDKRRNNKGKIQCNKINIKHNKASLRLSLSIKLCTSLIFAACLAVLENFASCTFLSRHCPFFLVVNGHFFPFEERLKTLIQLSEQDRVPKVQRGPRTLEAKLEKNSTIKVDDASLTLQLSPWT
jgi:hypothetical protein